MKSIFFKSLALGLLTLSLWSCKKDETQVVSNVGSAGNLVASATTLSLVQADAAKPALTLTYPLATSTGYVVPVATSLQFDIKGNNFAAAREFAVSSTTYSPTVSDFNTMLLALGAKVGTAAQIEVRLKSGAAANAITFSNVLTLTATPYLASAWIYVPGAYQGWNPSTADSLVSLTSNGIYTGMIAFTPNNLEFKITPAKKWDVAYGDAGSGTISPSAGDNLKSPEAIVRQVTVDLKKNTIVYGIPTEWSMIGDATPGGWNNDTDMKVTNDGKALVYTLKANLTVGEFKFRFGHAWDINLGGGATLALGGDNIKVTTAGTYTITLTLVKSGDKVTGGSYTIVKN
ncbi:SusE domain-containing protein [Pedobacter jejuensis]|uniref:SusF/SusE family outer membrane protein n=1 Tax=Pedobacter jejuensis TaxID=1268550 RepID=A0A3N0BP93_9SPHI|nr:SusF/SusE family outer membrane protein [Pedobacter jejuensis]RNL50145.1 SusF/SusE family outer membrane protein [Pedobacter jejuensis]